MLSEYNTLEQQSLLDSLETLGDIGSSLTSNEVAKFIEVKEVTSLSDFNDALASDEPIVSIQLTEDLSLAKSEKITIPSGKIATVKIDREITCTQTGFDVQNGATLILTGEGTIKTTNKSTSGAIIEATGRTTKVIINGITLDATVEGKQNNFGYGVYLREYSSLDFKSGIIKTAYGSCISTNNTTGGATVINISGGELYSDGSYALYIPSQCTVNITDNAVVQGINARMGKFNIYDNARIIGTTLTEEDYDNIGKEFNTSGCVWLGDTIAVMAGTYTDADGTECIFNIRGNAKVNSNFRSAIGIYEVDTKQTQYVTFNIANPLNIATTDSEFNSITIYDHEYIQEQATAAGKAYNPVAQSVVKVN